jgi:hypothetical protein
VQKNFPGCGYCRGGKPGGTFFPAHPFQPGCGHFLAMHPLIVGIDVGSVAVSLAVIGWDRQWVDCAYAFHERKTGETALLRQYCYYTQYAPSLFCRACATAVADARRVLTPLVHSLYGSLHSQLQLYRMLQSIGLARIGFGDVVGAYKHASEFKAAALERLKQRYRQETASSSGLSKATTWRR